MDSLTVSSEPINQTETLDKQAYEKPQVIFEKALEALAGVCSPGQPGAKADGLCTILMS